MAFLLRGTWQLGVDDGTGCSEAERRPLVAALPLPVYRADPRTPINPLPSRKGRN